VETTGIDGEAADPDELFGAVDGLDSAPEKPEGGGTDRVKELDGLLGISWPVIWRWEEPIFSERNCRGSTVAGFGFSGSARGRTSPAGMALCSGSARKASRTSRIPPKRIQSQT